MLFIYTLLMFTFMSGFMFAGDRRGFSTNNRCMSGAHVSSRSTMSASNPSHSCAPSRSLSAHNPTSHSTANAHCMGRSFDPPSQATVATCLSSSSAPTTTGFVATPSAPRNDKSRQAEICRYVRMNNYGLVDGDKAHKDYLDKETKRCLETLQPMTTSAPRQKLRRSRLPAPTLAQSLPVSSGVSAGEGLHVAPPTTAPTSLSARDRMHQRIAQRAALNLAASSAGSRHNTHSAISSPSSAPSAPTVASSWGDFGGYINQDSPPLHIIATQKTTFKWMVEHGYSLEKLKEIPFTKPGSIGRNGREYTLDSEFSRQELESMFGKTYVDFQFHSQRLISEKIRLKALHGANWIHHYKSE